MRTENASMDAVRAAAGVSYSVQKVSLSLSACKCMDNESCAGGWGSTIDIGGAMFIIVEDWMMILCSLVELKRQEGSSSIEYTEELSTYRWSPSSAC